MYKALDIDRKIKTALAADVPPELIQEREGPGKKMLSYISGNFVIDELNRAFNYAWSWSIDKAWVQESADHRKAVWKNGQRTGEYTVEKQNPVAHVIGTLTVYFQDENGQLFEVKKTATGSKGVIGSASEQESIFKAATTDALKKAASLLGIGASLYRDEGEQDYFEQQQVQQLWTPEVKEEHKEDLGYLNSLYERDIKVDRLVQQWSGNRFNTVKQLKPKAFEAFIDYVRMMEQNAPQKKG